MAFTEKDLERIGEYIQSRLPEWLDRISLESSKARLYRTDPELFERVIRLDCEYERVERRRQEEIYTISSDRTNAAAPSEAESSPSSE